MLCKKEDVVYMYTMNNYLAVKRMKYHLMQLEIIVLSEVRNRKTNTI